MSIGCGKKAEESGGPKTERQDDPIVTDVEAELAKQELFCGGRDCPSYITKIAVLQKTKLKYCTGFLTKDNVVVTASSCLPDRLRINGAACDKDVTFFFANKDQSAKPIRVQCESVLEASSIDSTKEPFLWRSDVAYFKVQDSDPKIKKELSSRRPLIPSRLGMDESVKDFYTWSVDQIDYAQPGSYQGIIRKSPDCRTVHNTYFNPLSNNGFSPVITLAGCKFNEGNSGAPVMSLNGKVRGIISRPIDQKALDEVNLMRILDENKPLKSLMHVSNFACAPIYNSDETVQNESDCNRTLDINSYDAGRTEMFDQSKLFKTPIQKMEAFLNEKSRYFKFKVEIESVSEAHTLKPVIECFKNAAKWLPEFNNNNNFVSYIDIPPTTVSIKMSEWGVIFAKAETESEKLTRFQFKPSWLRRDKQTTVYMWSDGPSTVFSSVPYACPGSLF